jgi:hypothetical protein
MFKKVMPYFNVDYVDFIMTSVEIMHHLLFSDEKNTMRPEIL